MVGHEVTDLEKALCRVGVAQEMNRIAGSVVVLADRALRDASVVMDGEKIVAIESGTTGATWFENSLILPGFIDLHTHGRLGRDTARLDADLLRKYAWTGTTSLLPTYVAPTLDEMMGWLGQAEELQKSRPAGVAEIISAHLEGPFIDPANRGGIAEDACLAPSVEMMESFLRSPVFRYMTLSPYLPGAIEMIRHLSEAGRVCVAGHSRGSAEIFDEAHRAGLRGICHFLNNNTAFEDVFSEKGVRRPTLDEVALIYDDVFLEMICDLQHVDPVFIKLAHRIKGAEGIAVVTDSISAAGLPEGVYDYHDGRKYEIKDGGVHECETGGRFGSCVTQIEEFANLVGKVGISHVDAARMCALTPAAILGVESRKGSLAVGKDADIVVADRDTFELRAVYARGRLVEPAA